MFLVAVTGTIAVGKSTFMKELRRLPQYRAAVFTSIDQCRIQAAKINKGLEPLEIEVAAWEQLQKLVLRAIGGKHLVFVESSGASWRLKEIFNKLDKAQAYIVRLDAPADLCKHRLKTRKIIEVPFPYDLDPYDGIYDIQEIIDKEPYHLKLDAAKSPGELVQLFLPAFSLYRTQNEEKILDRFVQLDMFKSEATAPAVLNQLIEIPKEIVWDSARFDKFIELWKATNCKRCYLASEGRQQIVVYRGKPISDIVLIGEAPGADEDIQGKPFVGKAGKLLDDVLKAVDIIPDDCYFTNICKCRPENNATPTEVAWAACEPYLTQELALKDKVHPIKAIITVGAVALKALTKNPKLYITKEVGKWFEYEVNGRKVPMFSLYHTAYLLRKPETKADMWEHIQRFKKEYLTKGA